MNLRDILEPLVTQVAPLLKAAGREMPPQVEKIVTLAGKADAIVARLPRRQRGVTGALAMVRGVETGITRSLDAVPTLDAMLGFLDGFLEATDQPRERRRDLTRRSRTHPSMKIRLQDMEGGGVRMTITDDDHPKRNRTWEFPAGTDAGKPMRVAQDWMDHVTGGRR